MQQPGMSPIVKTMSRIATGFILLFGIYVVLYGHLSPGGGFAGGVVLAAGLILLVLAFGGEFTNQLFSERAVTVWESGGALGFLCIALLGYFAGMFFFNFLGKGTPFHLLSGGMIPLSNLAIGAKVGSGLFGVFLALAIFRLREPRGSEELIE